MKKINLSRKSKLFIGGIGSLAVLATIPAAVVACGSDTSQNTTTASVAQAYSQIQNTYALSADNALTKAGYDFSLINQGDIANVLNTAAILPSLPSGLSYKYTVDTTGAGTAGSTSFAFSVQIVGGPYSQVQSRTKKVTVNLPSGATGVTAVALTSTTAADFTKLVNDSINKQSFAANLLGQSTIASTTASTPALVSTITAANLLTFTDLMPVINYAGITVAASNLALASNGTSVTATLTFTGTNVPASTTADITITGFMPVTPSQSEVNQVQENLDNYIQGLVLSTNGFNITSTIAQTPSEIINSNVKATSSQYALLFTDLLPSSTSGATAISTAFAATLPANITAADVIATVANNNTASSQAFSVTLQIVVGNTTASGSTVSFSVIANTPNKA